MSKRHMYILLVLSLAAMMLNMANTSCKISGSGEADTTEVTTVEVEPIAEPNLVNNMLALNGKATAIACYNDLASETDGNPVSDKCEAYREAWESANLICKGKLMITGSCGEGE